MAKKPVVKSPPETTVYPAQPSISDPFSDILGTYGLPANSLHVEVLRSHDQLYEGQIVVLPNNDRTAGLINGGFVQLVPPPILGVEGIR